MSDFEIDAPIVPAAIVRKEPASFPPKIAAAIVKVMKAVNGQLDKNGFNKHGQYKYATVDDFYDFMRARCADAGLAFIADELEREVIVISEGKAPRLRLLYAITIVHESGESYSGIERETMVVADGPQAYGSGQSFVLKYFLRALFMVPTGEPDADAEAAEPLPPSGKKRPNAPVQDASETKLKQFIDNLKAFLDGSPSAPDLLEFEAKNGAGLKRLRDAYKDRDDVKPLLGKIEAIYEQNRADAPQPE